MMFQSLMIKGRGTENPRVGGSNPPLGTTNSIEKHAFFGSGKLGNPRTNSAHRTHENRHSRSPAFALALMMLVSGCQDVPEECRASSAGAEKLLAPGLTKECVEKQRVLTPSRQGERA